MKKLYTLAAVVLGFASVQAQRSTDNFQSTAELTVAPSSINAEAVDTTMSYFFCTSPQVTLYLDSGYVTGTNGYGDQEMGTVLYADGSYKLTHVMVAVPIAKNVGGGSFSAHVYSVDTTAGTTFDDWFTHVATSTPVSVTNVNASTSSITPTTFALPNPPVVNGFYAISIDVMNAQNDTITIWATQQGLGCGGGLAFSKLSDGTISSFYSQYSGSYDPSLIFWAVTDDNVSNEENMLSITSTKAFPNPAMDNVNILYSLNNSAEVTLNIVDIQGRTVKSIVENQTAGGQQFNVNVEELNAGTYFYSIVAGDEVMNGKFVVRH